MKKCFSGAVGFAVWLALSLLSLLDASAQDTQKAYWCRHENGAEYAQAEPCAPGTEVRTGEMKNGLIPGQEVQSAAGSEPAAPAPVVAPVTRTAPGTASGALAADDVKRHNDQAMQEGRIALLKYLAFGLVFGMAAKALGRSFGRWFAGGVALRFVLVALNLMKF